MNTRTSVMAAATTVLLIGLFVLNANPKMTKTQPTETNCCMIDQRDLNGFTEIVIADFRTPVVNLLQCFTIYGETTYIHYVATCGTEFVQPFADNATMLAQLDVVRQQLSSNKGSQFVEIIDTTLTPNQSGYFINLRELFSYVRNVNIDFRITFASTDGASLDYDCVTGTNYKTILHYFNNLLIERGMMIDNSTSQLTK